MINKHAILVLSILVLLAACQPAVPVSAPIPLTGAHASVLGASALTIQSKPGNSSMLQLTPVLADTGQPVPGFAGIDLGINIQYGFSPNREQLAVVSDGTSRCAGECFHLIDLRAWKESLAPVAVGSFSYAWAPEIVFDPPAARAAFVLSGQNSLTGQAVVVDLKTGKSIQAALDFTALRLHFTPAGSLALYGFTVDANQKQHIRIAIVDSLNLSPIWQQDLPDVSYGSEPTTAPEDPAAGRYLDPGVAFSPDGGKLYLVAADAQKLFTVDFERRSVSSTAIRPPQSLLDRLMAATAGVAQAKMLNGTSKAAVISNDGKRLYVVGQTTTATKLKNGDYDMQVTPLGLQVIDPASGTELATQKTDASYLSIAPDGKSLFLYSWPSGSGPVAQPFTDLFDPAALKITRRLAGEVRPTRLLNGEMAWLGNEPLSSTSYRLSIFAPGSRAPRSQWTTESDYTDWVAIP